MPSHLKLGGGRGADGDGDEGQIGALGGAIVQLADVAEARQQGDVAQSPVGACLLRNLVIVVARVHVERQAALLHLVHARDLARLRQRRQQHRRQDGDDGNHNQQSNQGKAPSAHVLVASLWSYGSLKNGGFATIC